MRILLIALFGILLLNPILSTAQNRAEKISEKDWDTLIQLLTDEKWDSVENLSMQYLNRFDINDDSLADPAIVRYMYLRCIAARFSEKTYDEEQSLKKVEFLTGKTIITPPKEFYSKCEFNCLQLTEDQKNLRSCGSNNHNTIIQTFETYIMSDTNFVKTPDLIENKDFRLGGVIKSIKAGGVTMPRLEVIIEDAFVWEEEGE